jgi:aminoglycoside phosphotransferase (APT) family kinase protein
VKFARVPEAEAGLEREARVLRRLGEERPDLGGVPHLRGKGRRAGRLAVVEDVVEGRSLLDLLQPDNFEEMALRVTRLLIDLARTEVPGAEWRQRLVEEPLAEFENQFGPVLGAAAIAQVRETLAGLGELPPAPEHRDCSPWNIVIAPSGEPVLLDWESAEPDGLPALDLIYFLANCAFVLDKAFEGGSVRETYARLLDPAGEYGRIAQRAVTEYARALRIPREDFRRLRLLCWVVHSRSDYRHLQLEAGGTPRPGDLRKGIFLGLIEEELR